MKSRKMSWEIMRKVAVMALCLCMITAFAACGSSSDTGEPAEKEYVKDDEIAKVLKDPDAYKGKYIRIGGKVFNIDREGDTMSVQAWHDTANSEEDFLAYMDTKEDFKVDDYVIVDGYIEGVFDGENAFGGEVHTPQIKAESIEKSTYQDVVAPTLQEKEVDKSKKQHGVKVTLKKVEYAESETRLYVTVKNKSKDKVSIYTGSAKLVQNGKQYEPEDNWEADYPSIDEVAAGASADGIICFKPLDPEKEAKLILEAYSDDYEIEMKDFKIKF